jgi:hypothetical protein
LFCALGLVLQGEVGVVVCSVHVFYVVWAYFVIFTFVGVQVGEVLMVPLFIRHSSGLAFSLFAYRFLLYLIAFQVIGLAEVWESFLGSSFSKFFYIILLRDFLVCALNFFIY